MKKFASILLTIVLCLSMMPFGAAQAAEKTYEFVFIVKSMQFSFMLSMIDGAEAAAALVDNIHIVAKDRRPRTASASRSSSLSRPLPMASTRL